jgi:hypothetical protein
VHSSDVLNTLRGVGLDQHYTSTVLNLFDGTKFMLIDVQASGQYAGLVAGIPHRPAGRDGADRSRQG